MQADQWGTLALSYEAILQPKPGLVDPLDPGAHHDMDIYTFLDSIAALQPFFKVYYETGKQHRGSPKILFEQLRMIGIDAERAMFQATGGINTHKGANFSFALLLGATGQIETQKKLRPFAYSQANTKEVLEYVQSMTLHLIETDLANLPTDRPLTAGEQLYQEHGRLGVRGEAAAGYPALQKILLPYLRTAEGSREEKLLRSLLKLMASVEDSNLYKRGGVKAWQIVQSRSASILERTSDFTQLKVELQAFNQDLIGLHLSPGGSADLLSLGIYFAFLEGIL